MSQKKEKAKRSPIRTRIRVVCAIVILILAGLLIAYQALKPAEVFDVDKCLAESDFQSGETITIESGLWVTLSLPVFDADCRTWRGILPSGPITVRIGDDGVWREYWRYFE